MNKFLKVICDNLFSVRKKKDWTCTYTYITVLGFKKIVKPKYMILYAQRFKREFSIEEKKYILEYQFNRRMGYIPDIDNPKTFNEKLQWLKLYYHNPLITKCVDKLLAKDYVSSKIGAEHVVPLIRVYDSPKDIIFSELPDSFVLKTNWGCGNNIIVRDKQKINIKETIALLSKWMTKKKNHYYLSFEWGYKNISPKIICEQYVGELGNNLTCYKFFCFNSNPFLIQAVFDDKTEKETINYYDLNWNRLDIRQNFPNNNSIVPAPKTLKKMIEISKKLSEDFPYFVRVDLYEVNDHVLFSEFTFYSDNGMTMFHPEEWDFKLGNMISLPVNKE
ncbi:TupA-like ATPgrasp [Succinivibrio dextrinosolvens]|uniref:ATP-grasp fold amidoligase family protein n=1 Tax=Succinivibrio dextrinosolvens TaxID=83771 RepID=UPI0008EA019A|nr:ATP-grasp fold amidoligase family protein [Succinivibrio dextrinosolvens]SFS89193.1 TupA-like ATPgrasp [Succinivibrio dextrinosolvens]